MSACWLWRPPRLLLQVKIPKSIGSEERNLMEQLRELQVGWVGLSSVLCSYGWLMEGCCFAGWKKQPPACASRLRAGGQASSKSWVVLRRFNFLGGCL